MAIEDRYANVPFDEAIDYLRQKINIPTDRWDDILDSEHDAAFVVAGAKGNLLSELRQAVERAIASGQRPEDFKAEFERISEGWAHTGGKAWRANIIYSTNLRVAYAAGRYTHQLDPDVLDVQPYLQWIHGDSRSPRPAHLALDEKVFRATDLPMYPPAGYGCSCRTISLTERQVEQEGLEVESIQRGDLVEYRDERNQIRQARIEPDRGFDFRPEIPSDQRRQDVIDTLIARSTPKIRRQIEAEIKRINREFDRRREQQPPEQSQPESPQFTEDGLPVAVLQLEDKIRLQKFESAAVFDLEGNLILFKDGQQYSVEFEWGEVALMKEGIFTHNHPRGWEYPESDPRRQGNSFSPEDWRLAALGELAEMRAVSVGHRHSIKPPPEGWNGQWIDEKLIPAFEQASIDLEQERLKRLTGIGRAEIEKQRIDFEVNYWHYFAIRVAELTGAQYERIEYKPYE